MTRNVYLTNDEVLDTIAAVRYKPGFEVSVRCRPTCLEFDIDRLEKDADHPRRKREAFTSSFCTGERPATREELLRMLVAAFQFVELHTLAEWLRVGESRVLAPHGTPGLIGDDQYSTEVLWRMLELRRGEGGSEF